MLKAIFKGGATTVIVHSGPNPLQENYYRLLENRTKPNLAKLTIPRQIVAIVLAMWKRQERYNPAKMVLHSSLRAGRSANSPGMAAVHLLAV